MQYAIIAIVLIFSIIGFNSNLPTASNQNILNLYFYYTLSFIGSHIFLFLLGFIAVAFLVFKSLKIEKKHPFKNRLIIIATQTLFVFITGIFLSLFLLIFVAIIELNFLAYCVDINPKILGIQSDINNIKSYLIKNAQVPEIITSEDNSYKKLQAIGFATTGTNSFYGKYILASIPSFLVIPASPIKPIILIDKTLIISGMDKKSLETISPVLGYLFIKNYFSDKYIKHYPKINILNESEHATFRKADFSKKLKELEKQIQENETQIASTSALITSYTEIIESNKKLIDNTYAQKSKDYNKCIAKGNYVLGVFVKSNTKNYCDSLVENYNKTIEEADNEVEKLTKELKNESELLKTYTTYDAFFKAQSKLTDALKINIPQELGLFTPKDAIKVMIETKSPHAIADYLETVTHEYYHYASHLDNKSFKTLFFEESLTEYFARNTITSSLNIETNMGFPIFVKIINQITNLIPETELADIYFSKDEKQLEVALNRVYGDNFYKNNLILFTALPYTTNAKQLLELSNKIMAKINGPTLKEKDLYSTESHL